LKEKELWLKLRHVVPSKALRTLYYYTIHPFFLHGIVIWEIIHLFFYKNNFIRIQRSFLFKI